MSVIVTILNHCFDSRLYITLSRGIYIISAVDRIASHEYHVIKICNLDTVGVTPCKESAEAVAAAVGITLTDSSNYLFSVA